MYKRQGQDISQVTIHSLREQMGIMMQDSFIFSGDIEDNIRYGKPVSYTHLDVYKRQLFYIFINKRDVQHLFRCSSCKSGHLCR